VLFIVVVVLVVEKAGCFAPVKWLPGKIIPRMTMRQARCLA